MWETLPHKPQEDHPHNILSISPFTVYFVYFLYHTLPNHFCSVSFLYACLILCIFGQEHEHSRFSDRHYFEKE